MDFHNSGYSMILKLEKKEKSSHLKNIWQFKAPLVNILNLEKIQKYGFI